MKISRLILFLFVITIIACGPSKKEEEKKKHIDDSLMEIQRNSAINNAEKFLKDSTEVPKDSARKTVKK
jgi:hypothetical protein